MESSTTFQAEFFTLPKKLRTWVLRPSRRMAWMAGHNWSRTILPMSSFLAELPSWAFTYNSQLSVVLYGKLESLLLLTFNMNSLDLKLNRSLIKLSGTTDINVIKDCLVYFGIQLLIGRRTKFLTMYNNMASFFDQIN